MTGTTRTARDPRIDRLTGLPSRVVWQEVMEMERMRRSRYRRPIVVMSVRLVGLPEAAAAHGRRAADELLVAAASVLRRNLRDPDLVARIGENEFGVLLPETQGPAMDGLLDRIGFAAAAWRGTHPDLRLMIATGWAAPEPFGDLREALRAAERRVHLTRPRSG